MIMATALQGLDGSIWIEAEGNPGGGRELVSDPDASGGAAVRSPRAWCPLGFSAAPPVPGKYDLWVRYYGGPIQLKTVGISGDTKEHDWIWDSPREWTWLRIARLNTQDIKEVMVIRNDQGSAVYLDCMVWRRRAGDNQVEPLITPPPPLDVSVDWSGKTVSSGRHSFGLNAFKAFAPSVISNPEYQKNIKFMKPGLIRLHSWEMMGGVKDSNGWLDHDKRCWNREKVIETLKAWEFTDAELLVNIPGAPFWMAKDENGWLLPSENKRFADFCAELVRISQEAGVKPIKYWEITNEHDEGYWVRPRHENRPDNIKGLADMFAAAAAAMKDVSKDILTGGPAVARPDFPKELADFAFKAGPNLDFISFHAYGSGSADTPDFEIYQRARYIGGVGAELRKTLEQKIGRKVELHFNEFNISWTWETRDPRMTNNKGTVFDALVMVHAARAGVNAVNAWNDIDGIYGKMDNDMKLRPQAELFHVLNSRAVGTVRPVHGEDSAVTIFAVSHGKKGTPFMLLVNPSNSERIVRISHASSHGGSGKWRIRKLGEPSAEGGTLSDKDMLSGVPLPPHSVSAIYETTTTGE